MPPPQGAKIKYLHSLCNKTAHYPEPQQNQKDSVVQNLMRQWKGPFGCMEVNNKLTVRLSPHLKAKYTAILFQQLISAQNGYGHVP